jgi:hypothetical protein
MGPFLSGSGLPPRLTSKPAVTLIPSKIPALSDLPFSVALVFFSEYRRKKHRSHGDAEIGREE